MPFWLYCTNWIKCKSKVNLRKYQSKMPSNFSKETKTLRKTKFIIYIRNLI